MNIEEILFSKLDNDKIKINWNKNPIKMSLFLSFLKIDVLESSEHLGSTNGWTKRTNDEHKLIISGGIMNGVDTLDNLQYGKNLSNIYNNYVNPFYLFDILSEEGKLFFLDYYKDDIETIILDKFRKVKNLRNLLKETKQSKDDILRYLKSFKL